MKIYQETLNNIQMATAVVAQIVIEDDTPQQHVHLPVGNAIPVYNPNTAPKTKGLQFQVHNEADRYVRNERTVQDYQALTLQQQIYQVPDTYIGTTFPSERNEWLLDVANKKLVYSVVSIADGVVRCFLEPVSNSGDNVINTRMLLVGNADKSSIGSIDVTMDRQWIVIRNYGEPIPVAPHPSFEGKLVPDIIFGQLLTSSNYNTQVIRMGCGRNGYGAKLVAIFSISTIVKCGDSRRKQLYVGTWKHNMTEHESTCTPGYVQKINPDTGVIEWATAPGVPYDGPSFVEFAYQLDFERFQMTEYPDEAFSLYARYLIDFSFTCKVPVSFNGSQLDYRAGADYATLLASAEECKTMVTHYEWAGGVVPADLKDLTPKELHKAVVRAEKPEHIPIIEMFAIDTPDKGMSLSFVNGLLTIDGGVHVDECTRALSAGILAEINESIKKTNKKKKGEEAIKLPTLNIADVRPHMTVIVNARLPDPKYNSQSKTKLMAPKPKITIDQKSIGMVGKWALTDRLYAQLDAKLFKTMAKNDGKGGKRHLRVEKGEDAEEAGGPESSKCIFYLVEGDSAASLPRKRISWSPGGKKYGGYFPGKGKFINTLTASAKQLAGNNEIAKIKEFLGLCEGMDVNDPNQMAKLRYGLVLLAADADADGKHITCLWLNLFYTRWKSMIQQGKIGILMSYMAKAIRVRGRTKDIIARFLNKQEVDKWVAANPNFKADGIRIKYYKGLGSMTDEDMKDDLGAAPMVVIIYDNESPEAMNLVFHGKFADQRKEWIAKWREISGVEDVAFVPITAFDPRMIGRTLSDVINKDLIEYTLTALKRAIPSFYDGHKDVQRKAEYYSLKKWKYGKSDANSTKVVHLASNASGDTEYHHGPKSMADAIVKKTQYHHGTNNLPFFDPQGQFGTRVDNEDAADARYSETKPDYWVQYAYDKELINLVPLNVTEGIPIEPQWLPCIIPMHLINGYWGIATGHSTYGPNHNPYHIIDAIITKCQGGEWPDLVPWYMHHTGEIKIVRPVQAVPKPVIVGVGAPQVKGPNLIIDGLEIEEDDETIPDEAPIHVADEDDTVLEIDDEVTEAKDAAKIKGTSMRTFGKFQIIGNIKEGSVINITELPIGRWILPYKKWLESLQDKGEIVRIEDRCTFETVNFVIYGFKNPKGVNYNTLKLQKSYGMSNMTLIDHNGYPYKFRNAVHVIDVFYQSMISLFRQVIDNWTAEAKEKIVDMKEKQRLIQAIVDGVIVVFKQADEVIYAQLDQHKIDPKYWEKLKASEMSQTKIDSLSIEIMEQEAELVRLSTVTPQKEWVRRLLILRKVLEREKYPYA
jgi:DNA topoisomerase-2